MKTQYNTELISVIIPCFNSGMIVKRAIDSIINQSWSEIEIILVNDGSTDTETLKILNSYSHFNKLELINQNNFGLSSARNNGVKRAKGSYLFFLDSDDWIEPDALEIMLNFLKKYKDNSFVFTDISTEGDINKTIGKEYNFFEQLFLNQLPYSILISKKNWLSVGGYDEQMKDGYEDWDLNIRLGASKIYGQRLAQPLFHYNVSNTGMLLSKSSIKHSIIWKYIINKSKGLYTFKNIIYLWKKWRKKKSSYPLIIFLLWYFIFRALPVELTSKIFIKIRNLKWFFTRKRKN